MIIKKYHSKSPQNKSQCCIQNSDINLNVHSSNNCINADRFYTPRRFTLLYVKQSGYARRYAQKWIKSSIYLNLSMIKGVGDLIMPPIITIIKIC